MNLAILYLKKREERRILAGHLWVYSNEVDVKRSPFEKFQAGELVRVENYMNKPLGIGYVNPNVLLSCRLLTSAVDANIDRDFFIKKISLALKSRESYYVAPFYRLLFGEGDYLPGLVVDRYGDVLVVQITTAGMENLKDLIVAALHEVLRPTAILWRNDTFCRELEGLESYTRAALGEPPQTVYLEENGAKFEIPLWDGQKTGWFYDQRPNRELLKKYVRGRRVLDVFSYIGSWGIQAALEGASEVLCVDSSEKAIKMLHNNARLNNVDDRIHTINDYAFVVLKQLLYAEDKFDVIILDPPALIKRRKDLQEGFQAYLRLQKLALGLLNEGGFLFTSSCSMLLTRAMLLDALRRAGLACKKELRVLAQLQQGIDHPINPAIWETDYLKGFLVQAY